MHLPLRPLLLVPSGCSPLAGDPVHSEGEHRMDWLDASCSEPQAVGVTLVAEGLNWSSRKRSRRLGLSNQRTRRTPPPSVRRRRLAAKRPPGFGPRGAPLSLGLACSVPSAPSPLVDKACLVGAEPPHPSRGQAPGPPAASPSASAGHPLSLRDSSRRVASILPRLASPRAGLATPRFASRCLTSPLPCVPRPCLVSPCAASLCLVLRRQASSRPRPARPRHASPRLATRRLASPRVATRRHASPCLASLATPRLALCRHVLARPALLLPRSPCVALPWLVCVVCGGCLVGVDCGCLGRGWGLLVA
ncbi:hypothetical protein C8D88_11616 [Lentzea atacamensis]|uniref:Uncharacterized protein n=1 Tax=Lentzea atacamensis TaxID=531938 RepID=A0A316HK50_9PSEU|nr:hypothetical protein C8D88_11616 [Lentzea atacamensis]